MERAEMAVEFHKEKDYNCAQSVLCAFEDATGLERNTALALTDGLGGGYKCGEICGALSGAVLAAGVILKNGGENPVRSGKIKSAVDGLTDRFKEEKGCLTCRELLENGGRARCNEYISDSVKMLEEILKGEQL